MASDDATEEIRDAVRQATRLSGSVRVLPTMPEMRSAFYCWQCGSNVRSHVLTRGGWGETPAEVCSVCGSVGLGAETWQRQLGCRARRRMWQAGRGP